jgi:hypothetical protein
MTNINYTSMHSMSSFGSSLNGGQSSIKTTTTPLLTPAATSLGHSTSTGHFSPVQIPLLLENNKELPLTSKTIPITNIPASIIIAANASKIDTINNSCNNVNYNNNNNNINNSFGDSKSNSFKSKLKPAIPPTTLALVKNVGSSQNFVNNTISPGLASLNLKNKVVKSSDTPKEATITYR